MKVTFVEPHQPGSGAVAVGIWEDGELTPAARRLDEAADGAVGRALAARDFRDSALYSADYRRRFRGGAA